MKALSLTQPWASLVAIGAKRIETRSWSTSYRGLVAIHASKRFPDEACLFAIQDLVTGPLMRAGALPAGWAPWGKDNKPIDALLPLGAIVAVAGYGWVVANNLVAIRWA